MQGNFPHPFLPINTKSQIWEGRFREQSKSFKKQSKNGLFGVSIFVL